MEQELDQILKRFPNAGSDSLIPILQEVQHVYGYIPEHSISHIGSHIGMATSRVFGVATFYDEFRFEPMGKNHIRVCDGTTCHLEGSDRIKRALERALRIKPGQVSRDGMFSIESAQCLGNCSKAPVIEVNGDYHERVQADMIKEIIQELKNRPTSG